MKKKIKEDYLKQKLKVFVGLSGGVDSAVSAALLKKAGYEVTGVFIKAWTLPNDSLAPRSFSEAECGWREDKRSAMRAAAILDIPFITLDLGKEYKKEVIDYMIREYKNGRTPNPDVICNKEIKFKVFLKFALDNGADYVATGHYARKLCTKIHEKDSLQKFSNFFTPLNQTFIENFPVQLLEGSDKNKDQSYFLWTLTQKQLKHILFPVGHLQKPEVRKLAEKFGLPQAIRKDSQGLCFLGKIDIKEFLSDHLKPKKGKVLNLKGEIIGEHNGAVLYTIGERRGFTVTQKNTKDSPWYVVTKNIRDNTISVAPQITTDPENWKMSLTLALENMNWISGKTPDANKRYLSRIRYRQEKIYCKIEIKDKKMTIVFDKPQMGVSSGQSMVLYDGEICLGGGIIV